MQSLIRQILFSFSLFVITISCTNNSNSKPQSNPSFTESDSITALNPENTVDSLTSSSQCDSEKKLINTLVAYMKKRVNNVRNAYNELRYDEIEWGKYIRKWNIEVKSFREQYNATYFSCIHSFYIGEAWISILEIGNSYAFDDISGVRQFEKKLNSDIASTIAELKSIGK
jgi:hypothetical protein